MNSYVPHVLDDIDIQARVSPDQISIQTRQSDILKGWNLLVAKLKLSFGRQGKPDPRQPAVAPEVAPGHWRCACGTWW